MPLGNDTSSQGESEEQTGSGEISADPPADPPPDEPPVRRRGPGRPPHHAPVAAVTTRTVILVAARQLFMRRGFADVAVEEVAEAAKVTKPTLYYHVGGKQKLYTDVLCNLMEEVGGYVRAVTERAAPVRERLEDLAAGYFEHADATMEPLLRDVAALLEEDYALRVRETYEQEILTPIQQLMLDGMRQGEIVQDGVDFLVRVWMSLLDGFTPQGGHTARSSEEHRQVAVWMTAFFLNGAAPR